MTAHHYMIVTVMDLKAKEPELDGWGVQWNQGREIRERERERWETYDSPFEQPGKKKSQMRFCLEEGGRKDDWQT
jgi:hypothetical protein